MLEAAKLTDGTGVRIALNILCISMKDALTDRIQLALHSKGFELLRPHTQTGSGRAFFQSLLWR